MKAKKNTALVVLLAFIFSIAANIAPVIAADSASSNIGKINQSLTTGSSVSNNKQNNNAAVDVNKSGAAVKDQKSEQKIVKPQAKIIADTGEVKLCRARIGRIAVAAMNYVKMAKVNKKTYPRSAKELVNANHISKDEIYCVHKEKGLFGEKKQEYTFKLQQPYEKFIVIQCPVHPENRMLVPMPTDMNKEELAKEKECKKDCLIKMISAAGSISRAVRVAVHDKKMYPREIGDLVRTNHLTKNGIECPQEIKKLFGTKHEEFMLRLQDNEKSYTLECPYHGNLINIKIPKYEDTLNVNEKEELAKDKEREEKLKQAVKDGLLLAAAAPLIPAALTVAGGIWAANAAYDAGKKAGAFVAEKGKEAGEAAAKTAKEAAEAVSDAGEAAANAVKETAQAAADAGKRAADAVVETGKNAAEAVANAGEAVVETGKKAADAVVNAGKQAVDEAGKALTNAGVSAAEAGINFLDGAQSFINGGLNSLKNGLSSWKKGLKN